jgi:DGQHR domain-containing protein
MANGKAPIVLRALHTTQGDGLDVYAFFIRGADILRVADISRVERDESDALKGFQRPEIKEHVRGIVEYLSHGNVLFPNAIILALTSDVKFAASRGTKPTGDDGIAQSGTLTIPVYEEGHRVAWIVDGQQRSLALSQANRPDIAVPVVGFVSDSVAVRREQFILINKSKPLSARLLNELLPETADVLLPRDLAARKVPSELCNSLNRHPASPFYQLIRRASDPKNSSAIVIDTALITAIKNSMNNQLGALAPFKASARESADIETMYRMLATYWAAVKGAFPDAWGKDPRQSRLMHSAGLVAMGVLMDKVYAKLAPDASLNAVQAEVEKVARACRWTKGTWEGLGLAWNEIQNTPQHIKKLQDVLVREYATGARR